MQLVGSPKAEHHSANLSAVLHYLVGLAPCALANLDHYGGVYVVFSGFCEYFMTYVSVSPGIQVIQGIRLAPKYNSDFAPRFQQLSRLAYVSVDEDHR